MKTWGEMTARLDVGEEVCAHDRLSYWMDGDGHPCAGGCEHGVGWQIVDGDYGRPAADWVPCFVGIDGPMCEWCMLEAEAEDVAWTPEIGEIDEPRSTDYDEQQRLEDEYGLVVDERTCDMGDDCCHVRPAPLGWYLDADDACRWAYPFVLPGGRLVCEDCAIEYEEGFR